MPPKKQLKKVDSDSEDDIPIKSAPVTNPPAKNSAAKNPVVSAKMELSDDSSDSETENESIKTEAREKYAKDDFLERVVKYIGIDDLMRKENAEHRERMFTLKEEKANIEKLLLRYLDIIEQDVVNIAGKGKLKKCQSVRKSGINKDLIKKSICEQLKKDKIVKDDKKAEELAEMTLNVIESKRETTVKTYIKRTLERQPKAKK